MIKKIKIILFFTLVLMLVNSLCGFCQDKKETLGEAIVRLRQTFRAKSGPGDFDFIITYDRLIRKYSVHVPRKYKKYAKEKAMPAVLVFNGAGIDSRESIEFFGLNRKSDQEGFITIYPEGTGRLIRGVFLGSWNAGKCCPPATNDRIDDVGFIRKLIDKLLNDFNIDPKRVYVIGYSNGALMAYRLACELSDKVAAIAVSSGHDAFDSCRPYRAVPVLHIHGTADKCAPYEGGECGSCFVKFLNRSGMGLQNNNWECSSVKSYLENWKRYGYCSDDYTVIYENKSARCISYDDCLNGAEVVLCTLEGMGHHWPGVSSNTKVCQADGNSDLCIKWLKVMGKTSDDLTANNIIWDFFKRHSLNWPE